MLNNKTNNPALNDEDADRHLDTILTNINDSLLIKAKEYMRNNDRMHNFNKASIKSGNSREKALRGMRLKHDISSDDIIDDMDEGIIPSKKLVIEKYGDIINYNILELMSILHKIEENEKIQIN